MITCVLTGIFFFPDCYYANCKKVVRALSAFPCIPSCNFVKLITLNLWNATEWWNGPTFRKMRPDLLAYTVES